MPPGGQFVPAGGFIRSIRRSKGDALLGAMLLRDALARSVAAGTVIGAYAVFVDAIDESAVRFYSRYGFIPIKSRADKLYLRLETVAATTA